MIYNNLEDEICKIFHQLNTKKEIFITWPKKKLGIHIIFQVPNVSSSIRIYPTKTPFVYLYAYGNKSYYLNSNQILDRFGYDFKNILYNFENNILTAPINELIQWQQKRQWQIDNNLDYEQYLIPKKPYKKEFSYDDKILNLSAKNFAKEIRMITKMTIKEKNEMIKRYEKKKEKNLHNTLHRFIYYILENFRKDILRKSYKGEGEMIYSLKNINISSTLLNDYKIDQLERSMTRNTLMQNLFIKLEGFKYSYLINRNITNNPTDITFKISWNN